MTHKEIKLVSKTVLWALFCLVMVWFCWSWWDVVIHSDCGGTQNPLNLFWLLLREVN